MVDYILDTNVFNAVLDRKIGLSAFAGLKVFAAHTQIDEIEDTPDRERRQALLSTFHQMRPEATTTSSALWDISKWDGSSWGVDGSLLSQIVEVVRALDSAKKKKVSEINQLRDALLGETAIRKQLTLVTNDEGLREAITRFGGLTVSLPQLSGMSSDCSSR